MVSEGEEPSSQVIAGSPRRPMLHRLVTGLSDSADSLTRTASKLSNVTNVLFKEPDDPDFDDAGAHADEAKLRKDQLPRMCTLPLDAKSGFRGALGKVLQNPNFDLMMGFIIVCNLGVMVRETDGNAPCVSDSNNSKCESAALIMMDNVFLTLYCIEAGVRVFVLRCKIFKSLWTILDLVVVFTGLFDLALASAGSDTTGQSLSLLRIFRVFRLLRVVRIFQKVPELHAMLRGFISAMQAMVWGFVMIVVLLALFSVLCVELIHPMSLRIHEGDAYCEAAFASVWHCMLMLFQTLVAGDSWGDCAVPIIKDQWWTFLIFSAAVVSVQLGFMNLILAVIVERAAAAKEEDLDTARKEKAHLEERATLRLGKLFAEIDADDSGSISLDELLEGYDSNQQMQNMFSKLDITRSDLEIIFKLMDTDNVGELSYDSLIESLRMCQMENTRKSLTMLRLQTAEIARCYKRSTSLLQEIPIVSKPTFSTTSGEFNYPSGELPSLAEAGSSDSTEALDVPSQPQVLVKRLPASEITNHALTQTIHKISYPHQQLIDMKSFETEVAEFRSSLDKALAGIWDSVAKFGNSVPLAWQGSNCASFAWEPLPRLEASGGLMQPAFVAVPVSDSTIVAEQGQLRPGVVSLGTCKLSAGVGGGTQLPDSLLGRTSNL